MPVRASEEGLEVTGSNKHFNVSPVVGIGPSTSQAIGQDPNNWS